jgi:hypothetical protein
VHFAWQLTSLEHWLGYVRNGSTAAGRDKFGFFHLGNLICWSVRPRSAACDTLEDNAVNNEDQGERLSSKVPVVAILLGSIAAFITAGVVSWSTPDGNLVVTLVPALAVGLTVFGLALRRVRRGRLK